MTENIVSYEQAQLLQELGFDWDNYYYYYSVTKRTIFTSGSQCFDFSKMIKAPTMSQALKWLREKKNICISIRPNDHVNDSGNPEIYYSVDVFDMSQGFLKLLYSDSGFSTYELALEDGVNVALDLI